MFGIKVDEAEITVEVKQLEKMLTDNPETAERLRAIISEDLKKARNAVSRAIPEYLKNGDPNEARRAVRHVVYKSILGGNINILNMQRGTAKWSYRQAERAKSMAPSTGRGGNRRKRTPKTARYQGYEGKAKGFILRWVNSGTNERVINFQPHNNRKPNKWNHHPNTGYRGAIAPRNFFETLADAALNVVATHLSQVIDEELAKIYADKTT